MKLQHAHPLTVLCNSWMILGALTFVSIANDKFWDIILDPRIWPLFIAIIVVPAILIALLFGWLSWYFTRFIVNETEVRIETGFIFKQTKQIALSKIQSVDIVQPFKARLIGLVAVKIDAGNTDSAELKFLSRKDGYAMRDLLLECTYKLNIQAHTENGQKTAQSDIAPTAISVNAASQQSESLLHRLQDKSTQDTLLIKVNTGSLIIATLLSNGFIFSCILSLCLLFLSIVFDVLILGASALFIGIMSAIGTISRDVFKQFHYRLSATPHGLKISRGLFDLITQTVPVNRIQSLTITQPWLWRIVKLYRVHIQVLGNSNDVSTKDSSETSGILLPAGTPHQVAVALSAVLPDFDWQNLVFQPVDPKHRFFRPISWKGTRYGFSEKHLVVEKGVLNLQSSVLPNSKIQSAAVITGPIRRLLGLASVSFKTPQDTTKIPHLDFQTAQDLAQQQLDKATYCRIQELAQ